MSIASEIQRLQGVKSDILEAIAAKGVTVPAGSALADCPELIGSIGGEGIEDINDYFENVYVYWNNAYNSYSPFRPIANFSNENLLIRCKLYDPSAIFGYVFLASSGSQYSMADIRVELSGSNSWLQNGTNVYVNLPTYSNRELLIEVERNSFKIGGVTWVGGYSQVTISNIWPIPCTGGNSPTGPGAAFKELLFVDKLTNKVYAHYYGAKRKSDGTLGVLEMVTGSFWTSQHLSARVI